MIHEQHREVIHEIHKPVIHESHTEIVEKEYDAPVVTETVKKAEIEEEGLVSAPIVQSKVQEPTRVIEEGTT